MPSWFQDRAPSRRMAENGLIMLRETASLITAKYLNFEYFKWA